jgi:UTP--glucose-1-phosphate uridylyltransferase
MALADELASLPSELRDRLEARGFRDDRLLSWAASMGTDRDARNRLTGEVEAPLPGDVADLPAEGSDEHTRLRALGLDALRAGRVAFCVLAGGMATRMGGVVKALVEALDGKSFLELRLAEQEALERELGAVVPLWLMTSEATYGPIVEALGARRDGERIAVFEQCVSLRLDKSGALFHDAHGEPSVYPTGHGDLPEALAKSGLLERFLEKFSLEQDSLARHGSSSAAPGPWVWIANLDNLGASIDPVVLGWHIAHGDPLSVELVDKVGSDRGGGPVRHRGRRIIAEEFRLPKGFDPTSVPVFNTNTFVVDARALAALDHEFSFVEVDKKVDGLDAVQFERLLGEITVSLEPRLLRVPREGAGSRFLPVKDRDELAQRREALRALATERGWIGRSA